MVAKVCFTAVAAMGHEHGPFDENITLEFSKVITNVGNAYDPTSGIFRAPVTGSYFFSFFYQAKKTQMSGLSLVKNQSVIIKTFDHTKPGSQYCDNGGNTAILKLSAGDRVSVQLPAQCCIHAYEDVTTFSGFLIAQE
ncbi:complement C1q tumor necrosis factor-related protein 3-like [Nelusetta ayraudi]|uniref:complement C1q tumor necrosis factor-related protein 3-like n=1 Tax=Nelusetta ayraudi TaxID=303726 RepID=UPI003F6E53E9